MKLAERDQSKLEVASYTPLTEEQIRAAQIGELAPLGAPIQIVDYDPEWPPALRTRGRASSVRARRSCLVARTRRLNLSTRPCCQTENRHATRRREHSRRAFLHSSLRSFGYVLRIREPDWYEHRMFKGPDTDINLHVFSSGCSEIDRMLLFRNWLRSNKSDRRLYERTKRELARNNWKYMQNYADAKTAIVEEILTRAQKNDRDQPSPKQ